MKENMKLMSILFIIGLLILLIVIGVEYLYKENSHVENQHIPRKYREHAKLVEEHLAQKYGKEFEVIKVENYRVSLGSPKMLRSTFHPVDRPDLVFQMFELGQETLADPNFGLNYDYIEIMWSEQIMDEFNDEIREIFGSDMDYYIYLNKNWGPERDKKEEKNWYGIPEYKEIIKKYPKQIDCFIYILNYKRLTHDNKSEEISKIQKLASLLRAIIPEIQIRLVLKFHEPFIREQVNELTNKYGFPYLTLAPDNIIRSQNEVIEWESILFEVIDENLTEYEIKDKIKTEKNKY